MKKFLAIILCGIFFGQNLLAEVYAITESPEKSLFPIVKKNKVKTDNKINYINIEWWNNFNDDILTGYINKALKHNYDLKIASISTQEYYQAVKLQFSNELPQAGLGFAPAFYKGMNLTATDWAFALPGLVSYEADIFLKNRDKTKSAKKNYEASLLDERAAYIAVASGVGVTYLNIVKLDYVIDVQKKIVDDRKEIYELMLKRNKHGLTSTADTIRADKSYMQAIIDLSELEKQREKLLHQLAVMIGESPNDAGELARTALVDIDFSGVIPKEISSEVILSRPDYLKAEKMIEKAGIDVRVAKKEFLPSINLAGLAFFNASDFGSIFTTANGLFGLGAAAILPVFTGGAKTANLRLKKAVYERMLQNYFRTNLAAIQEVNDAMVTIKRDDEKFIKVTIQKEAESKEYNYNLKKYEKGLISKLDLLQSQENLLNMDKIAQHERVQLFVDYVGLYKAVGAKL